MMMKFQIWLETLMRRLKENKLRFNINSMWRHHWFCLYYEICWSCVNIKNYPDPVLALYKHDDNKNEDAVVIGNIMNNDALTACRKKIGKKYTCTISTLIEGNILWTPFIINPLTTVLGHR